MPVERSVTERRWPLQFFSPISVDPVSGIITISSTKYVKVNQLVTLRAAGQEAGQYKVRAVVSETQVQLGAQENPFKQIEKPFQYAGGSMTVDEQERSPIQPSVITRAVYEEEPTVAFRNVLVDWMGRFYAPDNPLPVQLSDGSINIGTVNAELETQLSHRDNWPDAGDVHDSVRIGSGTPNEYLQIYPSGDIDIRSIGRTPEEKLKGDLLCAPDLDRDMTWAEIDGVRRVTQIVFTSASLDAATGDTITLTRTFTYQGADPFDLIEVKDVLTVV